MSDLIEYYNINDNNATMIYGDNWRAQTFKIGTNAQIQNYNLASIRLKIYRKNSPGTLTISIRDVGNDGYPTGNDLSIGTIDCDSITTSFSGDWYDATMSNYMMRCGQEYAIIMRALSGDSNNAVYLRVEVVGSYAGGNSIYSTDGGNNWLTSTSERLFEIYGDAIDGFYYIFSNNNSVDLNMPSSIINIISKNIENIVFNDNTDAQLDCGKNEYGITLNGVEIEYANDKMQTINDMMDAQEQITVSNLPDSNLNKEYRMRDFSFKRESGEINRYSYSLTLERVYDEI